MIEVKVQGMTCGHCVQAVTRAIQARDPQARVQVDLAAGTLRAETSLPREAVAAVVTAEGYTVSG
jgi:copper chaperone